MKSVISSLAVLVALGVSHAAMAQQAAGSEADYCRLLARTYLSQNPVQASPSVTDATLVDSCTADAHGTTAALKHKLADHGIDLPKPPTMAAGDGTAHPVQ
jgi:hypothetical protein